MISCRARFAVVVAIGAFATIGVGGGEVLAQHCRHDCPPEQRDSHGCCVAAATPPVRHGGATAGAAPAGVQALPPVAPCLPGMQLLPAGSFTMGSPPGEGDPDEQPRHSVTISPVCMDETETRVSSYDKCVAAKGCTAAETTVEWPKISAPERQFWSQFCNAGKADRANHPINCVDWNQAAAYCKWTGGRLPTESEWEYGARGSDGRKYPWGNDLPAPGLLNACGPECRDMATKLGRTNWRVLYDLSDGWGSTAPVGSYPRGASPFKLLDMAGNVGEWTADFYGPYDAMPAADPAGAPASASHVLRGGGWNADNPAWVRAAERLDSAATYRGNDLGFRCTRAPKNAP